MPRPVIIVQSDYDGYFEKLVNCWCDQKEEIQKPFNYQGILITADRTLVSFIASLGWSSSTVSMGEIDQLGDKILHLDFYSPIRAGFGGFSKKDVEEIVDIL